MQHMWDAKETNYAAEIKVDDSVCSHLHDPQNQGSLNWLRGSSSTIVPAQNQAYKINEANIIKPQQVEECVSTHTITRGKL